MPEQRVALGRQDEEAEQKENLYETLGNVRRFERRAKTQGATAVQETVITEIKKALKRKEVELKKKKKEKTEVRENYLICCTVFCVFISIIGTAVGFLMKQERI